MQAAKPINQNYTKFFLFTIIFYIVFHAIWFFYHGVFINVDSIEAYIPQSKIPLFSKDFFTGGSYIGEAYGMKARAYSYPLFLKLFPAGDTGLYLATVGQFLISLMTWLCFAFVMSRKINNKKYAFLCFFSILLVSFTNGVLVWDRNIAAESLTISSFLWVVILYMKWSDSGFKFNFFFPLIILVSLFFAGLRDTNPYFLVFLGLFSIVYTLMRKELRIGAFFFAGMMLSILIGNNYILDKSNRWHLPFGATFVGRLLCQSDQSAIRYFQEKYGMPEVPDSLRALRGTTYGWDYITLSKDPLAQWMRQYGKTAYTHYLISHPFYTGMVPLLPIKNNFNECPDITKGIFSLGSGYKDINGIRYEIDYQRTLLLALISTSNASVNYKGEPHTSWPTILLIPIVDAMAAISLLGFLWLVIVNRIKMSLFDNRVLFSMFLFLTGLAMAYLIWHADASAYARHLILTVHQLCLSCLMLFFFLYDNTCALTRTRDGNVSSIMH